MNKVQFVTYIGTKNDVNGNPRRAYIISEIDLTAERQYPYIIDVFDEDYEGDRAFKKHYPHLEKGGYMIDTSISCYKEYIKIGIAKRKGRETV
jgi:hypothetical protein